MFETFSGGVFMVLFILSIHIRQKCYILCVYIPIVYLQERKTKQTAGPVHKHTKNCLFMHKVDWIKNHIYISTYTTMLSC